MFDTITPLGQDVRQAVAQAKQAVTDGIAAIQRSREEAASEIAALEKTESQLLERIRQLKPQISQSDAAAEKMAGASLRVDAVRRDLVTLRGKLAQIRPADYSAADAVIETISTHYGAEVARLFDQCMEFFSPASQFVSLLRRTCRAKTAGSELRSFRTWGEATPEKTEHLFALLDAALEGKMTLAPVDETAIQTS